MSASAPSRGARGSMLGRCLICETTVWRGSASEFDGREIPHRGAVHTKCMPRIRIRLRYCSDPYTRLQPGAEGSLNWVDDLGTLFIDWDDGSGLGLVPGEDRWEFLA